MSPMRTDGYMTLSNMRANGVCSLFVYCKTCHNEAIVNVDSYDTAVTVPSFAPRMVCTVCGANLMYIAANKKFSAPCPPLGHSRPS